MAKWFVLSACLGLGMQAAQGATPPAACSAAMDAVVGQFLAKPDLHSPKNGWGGIQNGTPVVQSVCQRYAGTRNLWQVVYVIERSPPPKEVYSVDVLIALVDLIKRQIVASTEELLEPDGISDDRVGLRFASPLGLPGRDIQLLRLPNKLAKCADGYVGDESTVYLKRGKRLDLVIDGVQTYNEWWGPGSCNDGVVIESSQRVLSRANTTTQGMPDVNVDVIVKKFNEKTGKLRRIRHKQFALHYNGQRYEPSSQKLRDLEDCWLNPVPISCKNLQLKK